MTYRCLDLSFSDLTVLPQDLAAILAGGDELEVALVDAEHHWDAQSGTLILRSRHLPLSAAVYQVDGRTRIRLRVSDPWAYALLNEAVAGGLAQVLPLLRGLGRGLLLNLVDFRQAWGDTRARPSWWWHVVGDAVALPAWYWDRVLRRVG